MRECVVVVDVPGESRTDGVVSLCVCVLMRAWKHVKQIIVN